MEKLKVFLPLLTLLILCGCSNNSNTLDHRSIQYKNHVFSIGDTREDVENILGDGYPAVHILGENYYFYNSNTLVIEYMNDRIVYIEVRNSLERYSMLNFDPSMSEEDVAEVFTNHYSSDSMSWYSLHFDQDGNTTDAEHEVAYEALVLYDDRTISFYRTISFCINLEDPSILFE